MNAKKRRTRKQDKPKGTSSRKRLPHQGRRGSRKGDANLSRARANTQKDLQHWLSEPPQSTIQNPQELREDSLDPWQREATRLLAEGTSVVVDAPTSAGKTRVVETYFNAHMDDPNFRAVYTTPVKSLSNDKLVEFREMFGDENVGIATGDVKHNLTAPIVVATLESYRNSLLGTEPDLGRRLCVFDEYHYIADGSRGSAWEEAIILTPPECQILMLSASVPNAEDFAEWMASIRSRPCLVVRTTERPVPLEALVFVKDGWYLASQLSDKTLSYNDGFRERPPTERDLCERLVHPDIANLQPCIVYSGRRLGCELLAREMARLSKPLSEEQSTRLAQKLAEYSSETRTQGLMPPRMRKMIERFGIAYHHSGLAPPVRVAIERLLKAGELRFCAATMGLSLGINFSVRSAVITDYRRPGEFGFQTYTSSEILQMLGRAGRRGRDQVGFSLWTSTSSYKKFGKATRKACRSQLRNDPVTYLGLCGRGYRPEEIERFYSRSFHTHGSRKARDQLLLIHNRNARKAIGTNAKLPCSSPSASFAAWLDHDENSCRKCPHRKRCHDGLYQLLENPLAAIQVHLHQLGCLDESDRLTPLGEIAKYLPQTGGLLIAELIAGDELRAENLGQAAELMGAMALARFKKPGCPSSYRLPYPPGEIEERLEVIYPEELFPDLYDGETGEFRSFNPDAGYMVKQWLSGVSWLELAGQAQSKNFGQGDIMNLLFRVATYLQSLSQMRIEPISRAAGELRTYLLRDPLNL